MTLAPTPEFLGRLIRGCLAAALAVLCHASLFAADPDGAWFRTTLRFPGPDSQKTTRPSSEEPRRALADLSGGPKQSAFSVTPLHWAAAEGRREEVQFYLSQGVSPESIENWNGGTALHWAAEAGQSGTIRALLEYGANPNAGDFSGNTPLIWALTQDQGLLLAAFALIDGGANVNHSAQDGYSPLHQAARNTSNSNIYQMIRMLRIVGANPNSPAGIYAASPLHYAISSGNEDAVWSLVSSLNRAVTTNVNYLDNRGLTPLHWASGAVLGSGDQVLIVRALVDSGANINAKSPDGYTPLDYAVRSAQEQVEEELRTRGATRGRYN